jgi:transposase
MSGQQRVRRPGQVNRNPTRQPLPESALGAAALPIENTHSTYLAAKYRRIAARRGPKKALVAVEHAI